MIKLATHRQPIRTRMGACGRRMPTDKVGVKGSSFGVLHQNGFSKRLAQVDIEHPSTAMEIRCRCSASPVKRRQQSQDVDELSSESDVTSVSCAEGTVPSCRSFTASSEAVASQLISSETCDQASLSGLVSSETCDKISFSGLIPSETCDQTSLSGLSDCSSLPVKYDITDASVPTPQGSFSEVATTMRLPVENNRKFTFGPHAATTTKLHCARAEKLTRCEWEKCGCDIEMDLLMEHIRTAHVATQVKYVNDAVADSDDQSFVCLWTGCKVYNRPSCLRSWLERHIIGHLGDKPHRCIVAGCGARFASQLMLERHVNAHFSANCSLAASRPPRKGDTNSRLLKKRKLKFVRPCPVKSNDYFDSSAMELIQKQFMNFAEKNSYIASTISGNNIAFHCSVVARRRDGKGQSEVLIHWTPSNVLPDEWLLESDVASLTTRSLPLSCLPSETTYELFSLPKPVNEGFHRHRRK